MNDTQLLLAVDPSSTCIGYAFFDLGRGTLLDFGRVVPPSKAAGNPLIRIPLMAAELVEVVEECAEKTGTPVEAVIEVSEGKVHRANKASGGAGMSIYGAAWGYVWARLAAGMACEVVPANTWTRGQAKSTRQARVMALHRMYNPAADPGLDVSDAIALGDWWLVERDVRRRAK